MAETTTSETPNTEAKQPIPALEKGTYEILQARIAAHATELRSRLAKLNEARQSVFGAIETSLIATERITTKNNCTPRDIIPIGANRFLLGYNVHLGLRQETQLDDVFALYEYRERGFHELPLSEVFSEQFTADYKSLYRYYKNTTFSKFSLIGPHLFMEFRVGKAVTDIKTFKWLAEDEKFQYLGNRYDHEYAFPAQHEFEWKRTHRELHRSGLHPHISIEDRVFVECVGGDLTVKVEDNTSTGQGIYAEPVTHQDQTLDDAEIYYAVVGNLILLKIKPYQEKQFRYLVFNEKQKEVRRIDAIEDSCVLLPDGHGIIFARGYYLQSGEFKQFETQLTAMVFYKRITSPNGEDFLYCFYNRESGDYVLLSYNLIERSVENPMICSGFSLFESGEMAIFRSDAEPQKHHVIQVWQTPYVGASWRPAVESTSYLYKIGNPELVAAMAECSEVLNLSAKEDSFSGLYVDLVRKTTDITDAYFWLNHAEASDLKSPLLGIKDAASSALAEFEKVAAIKKNTASEVARVFEKTSKLLTGTSFEQFTEIGQFVAHLAALRALRGELIGARDLRYADLTAIGERETSVAAVSDRVSQAAVTFLLKPDSLVPISDKVAELERGVPAVSKTTEAEELGARIDTAAAELDLLIETVGNLKIQDATETTRVVENISTIYAVVNKTRSALRQRVKELRGSEATAEFSSQMRLLDQALANYLDVSTTPEKCDELLNRLMLQVEELEGRFADFEDFVIQLSEKRTAVAGAFESRKLELVEARNRKTSGLLTAAERILKGIRNRADGFESAEQIHSYFAADLMVEKVRDQIQQLLDLGDSVKADDLQSRLKTIREDALRQLRDRQDLFAGGKDLIQLGRHQFTVNTQPLDLTIIPRAGRMALHLTGTNFFEPVTHEPFNATEPVWGVEIVSETPEIYRGEYLAFLMLKRLVEELQTDAAALWSEEERLVFVRSFMSSRHSEGYVKGVHDSDGARILDALLDLHRALGLVRFGSGARACASLFWHFFSEEPKRSGLIAKVQSYTTLQTLFPGSRSGAECIQELQGLISTWNDAHRVFPSHQISDAATYLASQLGTAVANGSEFTSSQEAADLHRGFEQHLISHRTEEALKSARQVLSNDLPATVSLLRTWLQAYVRHSGERRLEPYIDEVVSLIIRDQRPINVAAVQTSRLVTGLAGAHSRIVQGTLAVDYVEFQERLRRHAEEVVPLYERMQALKQEIIGDSRKRLRLDDFKPKVLTSFVRNQLIDSVYLPIVGDNLAKQIGAAGDAKRTDRMGLLLLVSPPGYGKTTLLEYVASRIGIVFMKVNGPAIGHRVTSLDPAEAPNAAAREELQKLNLAFEMGDNVMVCLDDIQHLNPEFLQKFISLCDGQRRIEGVYQGQPRTYDLRGKKIVVVMAGNPYTESGEKFRIPDMLSNRADTYNLGDVIGGHSAAFNASYIENAATSNPVIATIASRHQKDVLALLKIAENGSAEPPQLEANYSAEEITEAINVLRKLVRVRDVVLRVNEEYIRSAAQSDAYRTEPAFKLQGSYRNMNRMAEKVSAVMNDQELEALIQDHYRNEAQTLTTGAEANLLKLKELIGTSSPEEATRWHSIRETFRKNQLLRGGDERDPVTQVVRQLSACYDAIEGLKEVLSKGLEQPTPVPSPLTFVMTQGSLDGVSLPASNGESSDTPSIREVSVSPEALKRIWEVIEQQKAGN